MTKLIVVLGGTGNQGASVIDAFLGDPEWKIRTVTRDPTKSVAKELVEKGVEVLKGDIEDIESLKAAFEGANVVFGVTDFWAPFFNPAAQAKLTPGQLINEYCYDAEFRHGKNIADAVATIADSTLDMYVFSSLSAAKKWSKGKYTWVYHFDSKAAVFDYIQKTHPALSKKTSTVQIGSYADNWKMLGMMAPRKADDGVYELVNACKGTSEIPWVDTRNDTGKFVRALVQSEPGRNMLGVSQMVTYEKYMRIWGEVNGFPARHRQVSEGEMVRRLAKLPDVARKELMESNAYVEEFGWDGGEPGVLRPWDLKLERPLTTIEEYIKAQDWSPVIG